jgi:DNA (cytosine-5)-methyltransferase 1
MVRPPILLDLFCGAGGGSVGYRRAGFDIVGVDINPQPNYPFEFHQADALEYLAEYADCYAAVHASPPCQAWSKMTKCRPGLADQYAKLIKDVRAMVSDIECPYVIENVPGAPLENPIELCGFMFGRELYRHRLFESNVKLVAPPHPTHFIPASRAGHWRPGTVISVAGHCSPMWLAREVMAMDWTTRDELREAIPPYYTEFVGIQLREAL